MSLDDMLDDSVDDGVNVNDALQSLINGQKITMEKIAEIDKKQTIIDNMIALKNDQRFGEATDESQNATALDEHGRW